MVHAVTTALLYLSIRRDLARRRRAHTATHAAPAGRHRYRPGDLARINETTGYHFYLRGDL